LFPKVENREQQVRKGSATSATGTTTFVTEVVERKSQQVEQSRFTNLPPRAELTPVEKARLNSILASGLEASYPEREDDQDHILIRTAFQADEDSAAELRKIDR